MTQLLSAKGEPLRGAVEIPQDPRLLRLRPVILTPEVMYFILSTPPGMRIEVEGWPVGAEPITVMFQKETGNYIMGIYHPDFPVGGSETLMVQFHRSVTRALPNRKQRRVKV